MRPSSLRVARQFLANTVQIEVVETATAKARQRFGPGIAIGRFLSPIKLYRVFDGEELRQIIDTGEIKGGDYSVSGERAFGSQWGSDRNEVVQWGERQRSARLGHELFVAQIEGKGRAFAHLSGADGKMEPGETVSLDPAFCSTGLGCSMQISRREVSQWFKVEPVGKLHKVTYRDLEDMASSVGLQPRQVDLYQGALLKNLPEAVRKGLLYEIIQADRSYDGDPRVLRQLGIGAMDRMSQDQLGRNLIRVLCKDPSSDCTTWGKSISQARKDSRPATSDEKNTFAVVVCLMATVAVPYQEAELTGVEGVTVKWVDLERKKGRDHRIWQPWGDTKIMFHDSGRVSFQG